MENAKDCHRKLTAIHHRLSQLIFVLVIFLPGISFAQKVPEHPSSFQEDKTWTFNAGLGSSKAWNLIGISKEFFVSNHNSGFVTAGLGEMILGAGVAYYENREDSGFIASVVGGTGLQFSFTYRQKQNSQDFLTLGGTYIRVFGFSNINHPGFAPVVAYEHRF